MVSRLVKRNSLWSLKVAGEAKILVSEGERVRRGDPIAVKITSRKKEEKILSLIPGLVIKAEKNRVGIQFKSIQILGEKVCGGKSWGKLVNLFDQEAFTILSQEQAGMIVAVDKVSPALMQKGAVLKIAGLVGFGVDNSFSENKMIELPVVVIEGEGREKEAAKKIISERSGEVALIDGETGNLIVCDENP